MKPKVSPGTPRYPGRPRPAPRTAPADTDVARFQHHYQTLRAFTTDLTEGRCRRTRHFDERLHDTVAVFRPLFAPWNMALLFVLYMRGPLRFNELKRALAPISSRVLTDKLRSLEDTGLVTRGEEAPAPYALAAQGEVVARHLHPLVFYLHNPDTLPA